MKTISDKLSKAIIEAVAPFKDIWLKEETEYLSNYWTYAKVRYTEVVEEYNRYNNVISYFNKHRYTHKKLLNSIKECWSYAANSPLKKLVSEMQDMLKAYKFESAEEYVNSKRTSLVFEWNKHVNNMINRLSKTDIDADTLEITEAKISNGSLDMTIKDKGERTIHARAVIAAADSKFMKPHFRFIVTEKKN